MALQIREHSCTFKEAIFVTNYFKRGMGFCRLLEIIHGANVWIFGNLRNGLAVSLINVRFLLFSNDAYKYEGTISSYAKGFNNLFLHYAPDTVTGKVDWKIQNCTQFLLSPCDFH